VISTTITLDEVSKERRDEASKRTCHVVGIKKVVRKG